MARVRPKPRLRVAKNAVTELFGVADTLDRELDPGALFTMPILTDDAGRLFRQATYDLESDFEKAVAEVADRMFGPDTLYVSVKKKMKGNEVVSIPDAYLVDMSEAERPKLWIVENEIAKHDPFRHVGIQLLRFATSFDEAKTAVRKFLMEAIAGRKEAMARLERGFRRSSKRNVDNYLDEAVYGPFRALVIIDEAREELYRVLEKINANISVLKLRTFRCDGGGVIHQFDTLYDEFEEDLVDGTSSVESASDREARRERLARSDTIVVPAREEGFQRVFLGENQWHAIRIGAAMKERLRYIAAYQVAPVSAVTHIAEIQEIRPFENTGKYVVVFRGPANKIGPIALGDSKVSPQGPVYAERDRLLRAKILEDALR